VLAAPRPQRAPLLHSTTVPRTARGHRTPDRAKTIADFLIVDFEAEVHITAGVFAAVPPASLESAGQSLRPSALPPREFRLTSVVGPLAVSYRNGSSSRFLSVRTRSVALETNATTRPSSLMAG
jgi:hypothetical protein